MSGKSESDATYCSEAEAFLAPVAATPLPASKLRRSQRLLQKPPDIKIKFNWDNFTINKRGNLLPRNRKMLNNPDRFGRFGAALMASAPAPATAPAHSADILAGLADTQNASEPFPPNQNQAKPKKKRRLTDCLPAQPKTAVHFAPDTPLDLCKRRKLDTDSKSKTALQQDIVYIDLTTTPTLAHQKDASLAVDSENFSRLNQTIFELSVHAQNAEGDRFKGAANAAAIHPTQDLGVPTAFMDAKLTNPKFTDKTCAQTSAASNHAAEPIKIRNKTNIPKKAPRIYKRRSATKAKATLSHCENRKEVVTKYVNLADFPEQQHKPVKSTIFFPAKIQPLKTERYFDNRTQQTTAAPTRPVSFCDSLLPTIYPPHFRNQIKVTESMMLHQQQTQSGMNKIEPDFYLTPDLTQSCGFGATRSTTSSLSLPDSLREVFDSDDLREILKLEKTVYHLSDQHVQALAVVLNLTVEYLHEVFENILTLSPATLQKIEVMLNTFPDAAFVSHQEEYSNQHNAAARTRPFNQTNVSSGASSSGASSFVECSSNDKETLRHFPSQHRTQ